MIEWLGNQKKASSNLQKLLHEQIQKAKPHHELNLEEATRLKKLEGIADKLRRREKVQNCQLQTWLSEDEYEQL